MKSALLFPGQGAQAVGMGKDLAAADAECAALFEQADAVMGDGFTQICFDGPAEELTKSSNTQPGIFVASMACYTLLKKRQPDYPVDAVAGLSSGEWTALHVAGVISFTDTLRVLEARGRLMQEACEQRPGAMLSVIGLDHAALEAICDQTGVQMANLNSPAQTVLSGSAAGIEAAAPLAKAAGAKLAVPLKVAGAFHSELMAGAAKKLDEVVADIAFADAVIPVLSNVTGRPHGGADEIRRAMVQQVTSSVHWYQGIEWLGNQGVDTYVECGPGKVLTGLVKRIDKGASLANIHDLSSLETVTGGA